MAVVGWKIAVSAGVAPGHAAVALSIAWVLQAVAYAALDRRLGRGHDATRVWIAGVAARALSILAVLPASVLGFVPRDAAVVYGLGLTMLVILEAAWLASVR